MRLTSYSHGAGCACKLGPADLAEVLARLAPATDERLLVGSGTRDDAAVWRLDDRTALVFTTDFFTPIVDDPFDWGRVAAANALSDVYAMGGRPILCLNIAGWPSGELPLDVLGRVLEGGAQVAREAGAFVAGGHTIDDREPKYGMAVLGAADPSRILRNDAARPGDALVLTKPLGVGVVSTALKRGEAPADVLEDAVRWMTTLNAAASEAALAAGARAATDVTGFGLLGHLHEMIVASGVSARVSSGAVPLIDGVVDLAKAGFVSGGTKRNLAFVEPWTAWNGTPEVEQVMLADAQTSGGLLIATDDRDGLAGELRSRGVFFAEIGEIINAEPGRIVVGT